MFPCEYRELETPSIVPEDGAVCVDVCVCVRAEPCGWECSAARPHLPDCINKKKFISKSIRNLLYSKSNFIFSVNHI